MKTALTILLLPVLFFISCKKSGSNSTPTTPAETVPTVVTLSVSNITSSTAVGRASVTSPGSKPVIQMGIIWGPMPTPYPNGYRADAGFFLDTATFSCNINLLLPNTVYYMQGYAANANGYGLGNIITFTTP